MKILVAPDSFKGTLSAAQVTAAVSDGVGQAGLCADPCPVADGGDGTMEVLMDALDGCVIPARAHGPLGEPLDTVLGWIDGAQTAVVETALASGLALVAPAERDAALASTFGTGELLSAAAARGARRIVLGVGGSATSDGGRGAIEAIEEGGGLRGAEMIVLCDVTTPFEQAAARFAPQKGADPDAVARLDARLHAQAQRLPRDPRGVPMTGAAGGLAGGLWARFGARLVHGAAWVLDAIGVDARLARAGAAILGEGCLDAQSFEGKIVGELVARCAAAGVPAHAIVGACRLSREDAARRGIASVRVASDPGAISAASAEVALTAVARRRR